MINPIEDLRKELKDIKFFLQRIEYNTRERGDKK
jgi:hypothetical protein